MSKNPDWVIDLFSSIDAMDSNKFASFMTDEGEFIFGNNPGVKGRDSVDAFVNGFFESIKGISHKNLETWELEGVTITNGTVSYTRHDDTVLTVDFCNIFRMEGDKISEYKIYIDNSELYK